MKYVDTKEALVSATEALVASPWAAVDTEADSLHHYVEKLCLIQVSVAGADIVIDPLAGLDLRPFVEILAQKNLILHGADFDLRMLNRAGVCVPSEIFDTMIAAQLLGYDKQGLADLVSKHCGIELSKSSQKADWSRRPLDEKMLTYAVNDTHHLKTISDIMREELKELGRLDWHRECCEGVIRSALAVKEEKNDDTRWQIKGSNELRGRERTILKKLWEWREEEAKRNDRPSFKVLNGEVLIQIARWADKHYLVDVATMPDAPRNVRNEHREKLNAKILETQGLPEPVFTRKKKIKTGKNKWTGETETRLNLLREERVKLGADLKIQPSLLATNATLQILALELPQTLEEAEKLNCLLKWQAKVFGPQILKILKAQPPTS